MWFCKYVNMTGQNLILINKYGEISSLESQGEPRIEDTFDEVPVGLAVVEKKTGEAIVNLPQIRSGVFVIVNPEIKDRLKKRTDLVTFNPSDLSANSVLFEKKIIH